mgnify:CR=1 FL=1
MDLEFLNSNISGIFWRFYQNDPKFFRNNILISIASAFVDVIGVIAFGYIFAMIFVEDGVAVNLIGQAQSQGIYIDHHELFIILSMVFIGSSLTRIYANYKAVMLIESFRVFASSRILANILAGGYREYSKLSPSETKAVVLSEVDQFCGSVFRPLIIAIGQLVLVFVLASITFFFDARSAIVVFTLSILLYGISYFISFYSVRKWGRRKVESNEDRFKVVDDVSRSFKEIKIWRVEQFFASRFEGFSINYAQSLAKFNFSSSLASTIIEPMVFFLGFCIYFVGQNMSSPAIFEGNVEYLGFIAIGLLRLRPAFSSIMQGVGAVRFGEQASARIFVALGNDCNPEMLSRNNDYLPGLLETKGQPFMIVFEGADLGFEGGEPILKRVEVKMSAGELVHIKGESGTGKTLFVDTACGLIPVLAGQVKVVYPRTHKRIGVDELSIGYVKQNGTILEDTVAANVEFGAKNFSEELVMSALRLVGLDSVIRDIYEKVGEHGRQLSGGQYQRLLIARALYRCPDVLVLDEGTSGIEVELEERIFDSVRSAFPNMLIIVILHRSLKVKFNPIILNISRFR